MSTSCPASPRLLTCAILDDEEINRLTLEHYVALSGQLQLEASLAGSVEGLNFFSTGRRVDVLFLDVEMPDLNGLDMLRLLPEPPQVVLTTAHESFAWEAFELRVADYLVKPFDYERFLLAVERVRAQVLANPKSALDASFGSLV
ncbi:LytR/AlgR family response regulator transcription factor [Hymenobacter chitinivorans]|uniref:Response regulator receiver domain-containing protein n=1 Tax=Hymenobacter chitinivorans DSM 11115 TaxID=1121954 RepID=A0A2M9BRA0_9BACT|nr:response regulator [Hymenobacter chitinivorans]PJJ60463.1 response regulator receiver domain-containing protein [Hymenobacter chitinivorans DSM 11115]